MEPKVNERSKPKVNERSTHSKLRAILGCAYAERRDIDSLDDLVQAVQELRSPAFMYYRAHRRRRSELVACSRDLIRERVWLCVELGLIDPSSGRLTKLGQDAVKGEAFSTVVASQVWSALERKGFDFNLLNMKVRATRDSVRLPTAKQLFEDAGPALRMVEFRRLLNLLVECGRLTAVQSRVYVVPTPS